VGFTRIRDTAESNYKLPHALSVSLFAWNSSAPTGRMFMAFDICVLFVHLSIKIKFHENLIITGTLHEYLNIYKYLTEFSLECETFQTKVVEKIKTYILCSIHFCGISCRL
jgi:hypothetical protein